jgi:uncharacterized protein
VQPRKAERERCGAEQDGTEQYGAAVHEASPSRCGLRYWSREHGIRFTAAGRKFVAGPDTSLRSLQSFPLSSWSKRANAAFASHAATAAGQMPRERPCAMLDPTTYLAVSAAIFAGAVVSGMIGFAFSAVAGVVLLQVLPPTEAVPLMMACSIITQAVSLVALRGAVAWRGNPVLIVAGALGVLPALYLLHHVDARMFRVGFGAFLAIYATAMLFRPAMVLLRGAPGRLHNAAIGFGGGLIGGLTAMPGAVPSIWCDLRGMPKEQQRGLVQPYIAAMQLIALALMLSHDRPSSQALLHLTISLPALAAGAMVGVVLFRRIDAARFRQAVLAALLLAGLLLAI